MVFFYIWNLLKEIIDNSSDLIEFPEFDLNDGASI